MRWRPPREALQPDKASKTVSSADSYSAVTIIQNAPQSARCATLTGEVGRGEHFMAQVPFGVEFRLEPERMPANPRGWAIEVRLPGDPERDLSLFATPPYRSSNPRHLDTGYGAAAAIPKGNGLLRILDAELRPPDDESPLGLIVRLSFEVELCPPLSEVRQD